MQPVTFFYQHSLNIWYNNVQELETKLASLLQVPHDKKIILWSIEIMNDNVLRYAIDYIIKHGLFDRTFWVLQPSHQYSKDLLSIIERKTYQIDLDLLYLNLHVNVCKTSKPNTEWVHDTSRFMFLTGKPDRQNRIGLLYKFYKEGLLLNCDWSLFVDKQMYQSSKKILNSVSEDEFKNFVNQHNRNLDGIQIYHTNDSSNHSNGYPFNGELYRKSSFRVISETMMMGKPVISEKTWITIANKMPFIMTGYPNTLQYLRESGYCTFEKYLPISDYDSIHNDKDRLDAVVSNTKFWLKNIHSQHAQIKQDIEHNYRLFLKNLKKSLELAYELTGKLDEPTRSIYSLLPLSIEQEKWILFYYNIKDPSWPDCFLEQNFNQLSTKIQTECIKQFGYCSRD